MITRAAALSFLLVAALLAPPAEALRWPPNAGPAPAPSGINTPGRPRNHSARKRPTSEPFMQSRAYRRNQERRADVKQIAGYIYLYKLDHTHDAPPGIPLGKAVELCRMGADDCSGLLDLGGELEPYAAALPTDPSLPEHGNATGYAVSQDHRGKVTVQSLHAEDNWIIKSQK